ncbi:MAG: DUF559 domain-containing protein, partial [Gallionella sp.]|nr:DUF559 domain-containing protein [Gallionella sp.]
MWWTTSKSPSPLAGEGLGRGEMEQREFAKHLPCNMTESENKLWQHLQAHRLNGEIMSNLDGVLAT